MRSHYVFDKSSFTFKNVTRSAWNVARTTLKYIVASVSLAVVYYVVFALLVSTDAEKRLRTENRLYAGMYPSMKAQQSLVEDAIDNIVIKDGRIYDEIFHAQAPAVDPLSPESAVPAADTIPDREIVAYSVAKGEALDERAARIEANFRKAYEFVNIKGFICPPSLLPIEGLTYAQVGASIGQRVNPFYKVSTEHNGIDLIATRGEAVVAAGDGVVTDVIQSRKGHGNVVEITHAGGYVTRYAHLDDISVSKGQSVRIGRKIGTVGTSGNSFAPHLHYEVLLDGRYLDPVHFFFASAGPSDYANMLYMSERTGQSMD